MTAYCRLTFGQSNSTTQYRIVNQTLAGQAINDNDDEGDEVIWNTMSKASPFGSFNKTTENSNQKPRAYFNLVKHTLSTRYSNKY